MPLDCPIPALHPLTIRTPLAILRYFLHPRRLLGTAFQAVGLFFASKMMVPSEKGLFTTFMAKLSCVGFDLGAPQKVRCISRLGYCAPFDAQFPICRWLVEGCAPCSHSPGAPDGSK